MTHNFVELSEQIAEALIKAAEDQLTEAHNMVASTKALAEGIQAQVQEQSRLIADMTERLRVLGESTLEAHRKFINGGKHD